MLSEKIQPTHIDGTGNARSWSQYRTIVTLETGILGLPPSLNGTIWGHNRLLIGTTGASV